MTRSLEDVARDAAPVLAELIRKYPPTTARAGGRRPAPSVVGEQGTNAKGAA